MSRATRETASTRSLRTRIDTKATGKLVLPGDLAVHVLHGDVLAATHPDDDRIVVRMLHLKGVVDDTRAEELEALAEGSGDVFGEVLSLGLGVQVDPILRERFVQNLCDFVVAPGTPRFVEQKGVFVANIQMGHSTTELLEEICRLADLGKAVDPTAMVVRGSEAPGADPIRALIAESLTARPRPVEALLAELPVEPTRGRVVLAELLLDGVAAQFVAPEDEVDDDDTLMTAGARRGRPSAAPRSSVPSSRSSQPPGAATTAPPAAPRTTAPPPNTVAAPRTTAPPASPRATAPPASPRATAPPASPRATTPPAAPRAPQLTTPVPPPQRSTPVPPPQRSTPVPPPQRPTPVPPAPRSTPAPVSTPVPPATRSTPQAEQASPRRNTPLPVAVDRLDEFEPEEIEPDPLSEEADVNLPDPLPTAPAATKASAGGAPRSLSDYLAKTASVGDDDLDFFSDHDHERGGEADGRFKTERANLDKVDVGAEEEAEPIAVDEAPTARFGAPPLSEEEAYSKIEVANEVLQTIVSAFDEAEGSGRGRSVVQLLVDGVPSQFAALLHDLRIEDGGELPARVLIRNLADRPTTEHRQLLNNSLVDIIERALSSAADELPDDQIDHVLETVAGYRSRLGL